MLVETAVFGRKSNAAFAKPRIQMLPVTARENVDICVRLGCKSLQVVDNVACRVGYKDNSPNTQSDRRTVFNATSLLHKQKQRVHTKLGELVCGGQGTVVIEEDDLCLCRVTAGLLDVLDGQLWQSHAVIEFLRYPSQFIDEAQTPVSSCVFGDISEELLMIALSRVLGHCNGLVYGIGKFTRVPRVDNDGTYIVRGQ